MIGISPSGWVPGDYRPVALIPESASSIAGRTGLRFESCTVEGLGDAVGVLVRLESGRQVVLTQYLAASSPAGDGTHVQVLFDQADSGPMAETLDEALAALGHTTERLSWILPGLAFVPHAIWRQDDHGQRYRVSVHPSRSEAARHLAGFESLAHKQIYWMEADQPATRL